eukprot:631593-Pleurochrysis_carterae.AAC.1
METTPISKIERALNGLMKTTMERLGPSTSLKATKRILLERLKMQRLEQNAESKKHTRQP